LLFGPSPPVYAIMVVVGCFYALLFLYGSLSYTCDMSRSETRSRFKGVPKWARDNLVLRLLDDHNLKLEIVYDRKYLDGLCSRPLIIIRRKKAGTRRFKKFQGGR